VDAQTGTLSLAGDGTSSGSFTASAAAATLAFSGGTSTLDANASIRGSGTVVFSGGILTIAGLQERDRGDPASFLRLRASSPFLLKDGDTEAQRQDLNRQLKSRAKLREMRKGLDRTWLTALGDLGLVGEVVVTTLLATACTVTFGIIIKETPKTVTVAELRSRLVSGDSQDG
jgi:hypothetical protein